MPLISSSFVPLVSEIDGEMDLPVLGDRLLSDVLEEGQDLLVDPVAARSPLDGPTEDAGTFTEFREMKFLGSTGVQVIDLLLQFPVEDEFKPIPRFPGGDRKSVV